MSYRIETTHNMASAFEAVVSMLKEQESSTEMPVVLVPTPLVVAQLRDYLTVQDCAFAVRVETLPAWIEDRWELFGDGRRIVSSLERTLFVSQAIEQVEVVGAQTGCATLTAAKGDASSSSQKQTIATPGMVALVSSLARESLPFVLDAASTRAADLSAGERRVVASLLTYAQILQSKGLCELSEAANVLPAVIKAAPALIAVGFDELSCAFDYVLETLSKQTKVTMVSVVDNASDNNPLRTAELSALLDRIFSPSQSNALQPSAAVRFLLPAGRYATPALVVQEVVRAACREQEAADVQGRAPRPIYIASREPAALYAQISDYLAGVDLSVGVVARTTFEHTDFGRAFLSLVGFACDEQYRMGQATDFALSSFSGISLREAYALDTRWRKDRTLKREGIAQDLSKASDIAQSCFTLLAQGKIDELIAQFEAYLLRKTGLDEAYRSEQFSAMNAARRFAQTCIEQGFSAIEKLEFLKNVSIAVNAQATAESSPAISDPAVLCMDLASVANRAPCSCSTLVMCDMLESAYPVRPVETGATLLLEKLNLCTPADALAAARRQFFRALSTACEAVVCERPLSTEDADEAYPAVMFEELIDCYRDDPTRLDDLDKTTGLPRVLLPYAVQAGEERLHENLTLREDVRDVDVWEVPALGKISASHRPRVVLPSKQAECAGADCSERLILSPSALESYLECPQKWFALRRLRLSELDAGFGPLEMGSFSHGVLKNFYERFKGEGYAKVSVDTIELARDIMRETFSDHVALQPKQRCGSNRLIPLTPVEQTEVDDLEKKLIGYLDYECELLPGFVPTYFEFDFGKKEPFFEYAGCFLQGSIDRIDVNEQGQAVVIDYKGSISPDYDLVKASVAAQAGNQMVPHKIQALMYAQAVRRLLGLDVVGALYVSYGRTAKVAGAYDRCILDEEALLGASAKNCGVPGPAGELLGITSFADAIDNTEVTVAKAIESLTLGLIAPNPRGKNPCGFCPVLTCPKRRSE